MEQKSQTRHTGAAKSIKDIRRVELVERIEMAHIRERNGIDSAMMSSSQLKKTLELSYQLIERNRSRANNATYFEPTVPIGLIIIGGICLWIGLRVR